MFGLILLVVYTIIIPWINAICQKSVQQFQYAADDPVSNYGLFGKQRKKKKKSEEVGNWLLTCRTADEACLLCDATHAADQQPIVGVGPRTWPQAAAISRVRSYWGPQATGLSDGTVRSDVPRGPHPQPPSRPRDLGGHTAEVRYSYYENAIIIFRNNNPYFNPFNHVLPSCSSAFFTWPQPQVKETKIESEEFLGTRILLLVS